MTAIDDAFELADTSDAAQLKYYERLAEAELFLMLEAEPIGDKISPVIFDVEAGKFALAFDSEDRLVDFTQSTVPFVALSGRNIAAMLSGTGIGLGVNLAVAPSSNLLPPDIVEWLVQTLGTTPLEETATPVAMHPPAGLPEVLITAIDGKLALMQGLGLCAYLAEFEYEGGSRTHALTFVDALPDAHGAIANAISETLTFSGIEAGSLDVLFLSGKDPMIEKLTSVGLRFDLPEVITAETFTPTAPGRDPEKPPKLT